MNAPLDWPRDTRGDWICDRCDAPIVTRGYRGPSTPEVPVSRIDGTLLWTHQPKDASGWECSAEGYRRLGPA